MRQLKPISIFVAVCLLTIHFSASFAQEDKEKAAIRAVVERETESYFGVDKKTWKDMWMPVSYAYWSYSDSTRTNVVDGWENIEKTFDEYFRTQKPSRSKIIYVWQEIRIYGNGAYVRFQQRVEDGKDVEETTQMRVLEKKNGKWKLICMNAVVK